MNMNTGELIKKCRKEMGMSAEDLAAAIGVSPSTIYRYENNDISNMGIDKLKSLASTLHTQASMLLGWNEFPYEYDEIIRLMRTLNEEGQQRLITYAEDLVASGKYKPAAPELKIKTSVYDKDHIALTLVAEPSTPGMADRAHQYQPNAAHSRNDIEIEESVDTSEDHIMDDENF